MCLEVLTSDYTTSTTPSVVVVVAELNKKEIYFDTFSLCFAQWILDIAFFS